MKYLVAAVLCVHFSCVLTAPVETDKPAEVVPAVDSVKQEIQPPVSSQLPVEPSEDVGEEKPCDKDSEMDTYDQRQNGTDNYRLHVDGLFIVIADSDSPPSLSPPAPNQDSSYNMDSIDLSQVPVDAIDVECKDEACKQKVRQQRKKSKQRLSNIILPLLKRLEGQ